jgi:hypothetical protein
MISVMRCFTRRERDPQVRQEIPESGPKTCCANCEGIPSLYVASILSCEEVRYSAGAILQNCNFCRCTARPLHFFQRHIHGFRETLADAMAFAQSGIGLSWGNTSKGIIRSQPHSECRRNYRSSSNPWHSFGSFRPSDCCANASAEHVRAVLGASRRDIGRHPTGRLGAHPR